MKLLFDNVLLKKLIFLLNINKFAQFIISNKNNLQITNFILSITNSNKFFYWSNEKVILIIEMI